MGRKVDADDLVGIGEIAARLGRSRQTVHLWRTRRAGSDRPFPMPVAELMNGHVFLWSEVERWAKATKRLP